MKILAISGSMRSGSYNRMALNLAKEVAPADFQIEMVELRDIPMFDGDELAKGYPASVTALREKVRAADGVLIGSPEYNFSIPGVVKNALDWVSRGNDQPFALKPVAIMSATQGPLGGGRSQYDLRKVMLFMNALVLQKPEIFIGLAQTKFDASGKCTDEATRKIVTDFMGSFKDWIGRVKKMNG